MSRVLVAALVPLATVVPRKHRVPVPVRVIEAAEDKVELEKEIEDEEVNCDTEDEESKSMYL